MDVAWSLINAGIPLAMLVFWLGLVVFLLLLAIRLVKAMERTASAVELISRKLDGQDRGRADRDFPGHGQG